MSGKLNEDECAALQELGLLEPTANPNKCKISSSFISPPTSSSSSTSSIGRVISANWASPPAKSADLVYPPSPVSIEALEFIGFEKDTAERIFANFTSAQMDDEDKEALLPDFIRGHLLPMESENFASLSPHDAYSQFGLTSETIAAILHQDFQQVFETQPPLYWAWDTVSMRYNHLLLVEERINTSAAKAVLAKKAEETTKG